MLADCPDVRVCGYMYVIKRIWSVIGQHVYLPHEVGVILPHKRVRFTECLIQWVAIKR